MPSSSSSPSVQPSSLMKYTQVDGLSYAHWLKSLQALYDLGMSDASIAAYFRVQNGQSSSDRLDDM